MARINIEDRFLKDQRFINLTIKLKSYHLALGYMVAAWIEAQKYWLPHKLLIPRSVWDEAGFPQEIIDCKLALEFKDGIKLRGIKKNFQWWFDGVSQRSEAGKKSAEVRKQKYGSSRPLNAPNGRNNVNGRSGVQQNLLNDMNEHEPSSSSSSSSSSSFSKKELTTKKNTYVSKADLHPLALIWNEHRGTLAKVKEMNAKRERLCKAAWSRSRDPEHWKKIVQSIASDRFCTGHGSTGWCANFDYFLRPDVQTRVVEGSIGSGAIGKTGADEWYEQEVKKHESNRVQVGDGQADKEVRQGLLPIGGNGVFLGKG